MFTHSESIAASAVNPPPCESRQPGLFDLLPELHCPHCGTLDTPHLSVEGHIKAVCADCGKFIKFVPQTPEWLQGLALQLVSPPQHLALAARHYKERFGWQVLPVNGKLPAVPYTGGIPAVESWPKHDGLALPLGQTSGASVLDFDSGCGMALYAGLKPVIPANAPMARSGNGLHVYFAFAPSLKTTVLKVNGVKAGEWRSQNSLIVLPPTRHPSGRRYRWLKPLSNAAALPALPLELHALILEMRSEHRSTLNAQGGHGETQNHSSKRPRNIHDGGEFWLSRAIARAVPEGRNNTGYWLACRLRDGGVSQGEAKSVLERYASSVSERSSPYLISEARASLLSAYRRAS